MNLPDADGFDQFWAAYPRRQAKKDARRAWHILQPSPELVATIVQHVTVRRETRAWREGFIPLPATFLRGERWEDELPVENEPRPLGALSSRLALMVGRTRNTGEVN